MQNNLTKNDILTVQEVADLVKCSIGTVYFAIRDGHLPAVKIGRGKRGKAYRVLRSNVDWWMQPNPFRPPSKKTKSKT
jgi:excisionase family DNA binding protein